MCPLLIHAFLPYSRDLFTRITTHAVQFTLILAFLLGLLKCLGRSFPVFQNMSSQRSQPKSLTTDNSFTQTHAIHERHCNEPTETTASRNSIGTAKKPLYTLADALLLPKAPDLFPSDVEGLAKHCRPHNRPSSQQPLSSQAT